MDRIAPTTKNYPAQNINSSEDDKPCFSVNIYSISFHRKEIKEFELCVFISYQDCQLKNRKQDAWTGIR